MHLLKGTIKTDNTFIGVCFLRRGSNNPNHIAMLPLYVWNFLDKLKALVFLSEPRFEPTATTVN